MLMAAGLGTRLRPFTEREPKAVLPLLGVPAAQFALDALASAGVRWVVANVHHLPAKAKQGLAGLDPGGAALLLSDESGELLGSAGGIRKAAPHFGEGPFFLLNADVLCDADLSALAARHAQLRDRHGVRMTLTVFPSGPSGEPYREILLDRSTGLVTGLGERCTGRPFWVGSAVLERDALESVPLEGPSEFVPTILEPLIRQGKVGFLPASGLWYDIGSPLLWWQTHLDIISKIETSRLPCWSERIERMNRRIAPGVWVGVEAGSRCQPAEWAGPAYWNPCGDETARCPRSFGPAAVLYGGAPGGVRAQNGIGYRGLWEAFSEFSVRSR